jgi:hypothetical protein
MATRGEMPAPFVPESHTESVAQTGGDPAEFAPVPEGIHCPDCGYDLRGLTGARCPECGFDLAIVRTQTPQIPWARRREIGRFKAYWQTVWLVGRHPQRLYVEIVRPVSYRDSQSFRWTTFMAAFGSILIFAGTALATERPRPEWDSFLAAAGLVLGSGLVLGVLPGAGSYALESRRLPIEQRNRGIALSYYAWGPLAAFALLLLFASAATVTDLIWDADRNKAASWVVLSCMLAAVLFPLLSLMLAEARLAMLARRVLREHGRVWLRMIGINALALAALLLAAVIPLSIFYFLVIWHSLH